MASLVSKPTLVETDVLKFLICDAPKDSNLHLYIKEMKKNDVIHIVRISEPSYSVEEVQKAGISLHEMVFVDGARPPQEIINQWLALVRATFIGVSGAKPCIAIHCIAGLGRAPVLVAIALIEYGMDPLSAVKLIRDRRRGAINAIQLEYLESYRPAKKGSRCIIM